MSGTINAAYGTAEGSTTVASGCGCAVCQGLQTFTSPIYATGGLLTADDLASEQAFVRAKMRLHNRHLHGWGTVCGLKVVCDDCDGVVRVEPGYAIDSCGNDIVLATATPFNAVAAIQACAATRPKIGACDPFVPPPDPGCQDVDTYWCVTLRYNELQTAQTAQYPRQTFSSGGCGTAGGCSCGNTTMTGGCTCGGSSGPTSGAATSAGTPGSLSYVTPNCTPRRLLECVEIGIEKHDGPCVQPLTSYARGIGGLAFGSDKTGGITGPVAGPATLAPAGSLLRRFILCVEQAVAVLVKRLTADDAAALEAIGTGIVGANVTAQAMHDALCRLRQAVLDFMMCHDPVRCQMLAASAGLAIPQPETPAAGVVESPAAYAQRAFLTTGHLLLAFIQTAADCLCGSLLPPCPPDPLDMRVPIACVTVRGGKIVDICNHACRRYAGSFPSLYYWLSALPIVPVMSWLIGALCCGHDAIVPKKTSTLWTKVLALDPTGAWRNALLRNKFAAPAAFLRTLGGIDLPTVVSAFKMPAAPVSAAAAIGQASDAAVASLARQGVTAQVEEVTDAASPAAKFGALSASLVESGSQVKLLVRQGVVIGVAPVTVAQVTATAAPAATAAETAALRAQIASLTERIAHLESGARP
jgi:hypothetical protein